MTSAEGRIDSAGAVLNATDMLSVSSKQSQTHQASTMTGGAISLHSETGALEVTNSSLTSSAVHNPTLGDLTGQLSLRSGERMNL